MCAVCVFPPHNMRTWRGLKHGTERVSQQHGKRSAGRCTRSTPVARHGTVSRPSHSISSSSNHGSCGPCSSAGCPQLPPLRSPMHSQGPSHPSHPKLVCVMRGWPKANGAGPRSAGARARELRRRSGCSAAPRSPSASKAGQPRAPGTAAELDSPEPPRREAGGVGMAIVCRAKSACAFGSLLCVRIALGVTP